jgi:hypothetical protein
VQSPERRLEKLEAEVPQESKCFEEFLRGLPPLDAHGDLAWDFAAEFYSTFAPWLTTIGTQSVQYGSARLPDPIDRGLAVLLDRFNDVGDPLWPERYRRRVPGVIIAALYDVRRNWAYPAEIAARISQLAGPSLK